MDGPTRCIECGGATDSLNEDEEGIACSACAERLLETLPGIFHAPWATAAQGEAAEGVTESGAAGDGSTGPPSRD